MEKSRYFRRDGSDVHTDAEISLSQAILGGTIRVQGVYEDQTLQVNLIAQFATTETLFNQLNFRLCRVHHHILKFV